MSGEPPGMGGLPPGTTVPPQPPFDQPPYTPPFGQPPMMMQPPFTQQMHPHAFGAQPHAPPQGNGIGVAAGVLGILALVLFWFPYVGAILGVLAIIFGAIGIQRANRLPGAPTKGLAAAGLVCGIVALALDVVFLIFIYGALLSLHFGAGGGAPLPTSAS